MPTILVTGSKGQLGSELQELAAQYPQHHFLFADVDTLDICDEQAIHAFFKKHQIEYCINCAAYTAVDKAESNLKTAFAVNVTGAKYLAMACAVRKAVFLHLSTDYVYHNSQNTPFKEEDPVNPQGVYARTKLDGERAAQQINPLTVVVRTSWVYSSFGNNFVKTMLRLGAERDALSVVYDQIGTPTYARDLAIGLLQMINVIQGAESKKALCGIYHFSNEGVTSWYDFAHAIFEEAKLSCQLTAIESKDYPTPAKRPHFSLLHKGKIKTVFEVKVRNWREALRDCLSRL